MNVRPAGVSSSCRGQGSDKQISGICEDTLLHKMLCRREFLSCNAFMRRSVRPVDTSGSTIYVGGAISRGLLSLNEKFWRPGYCFKDRQTDQCYKPRCRRYKYAASALGTSIRPCYHYWFAATLVSERTLKVLHGRFAIAVAH